MLAKRPDTYFIADYEQRGILVERFAEPNGRNATCPICGYAMIRLELANGWLVETCSAVPTVKGIGSKHFHEWAASMASRNILQLRS
jgi:hypothetical protein